MRDLSLHILDIAENSITAGAKKIVIRIAEDEEKDVYSISVEDDGPGMDDKMRSKVEDPFFTTNGKKKFGLGLPLLKQAALECDGQFNVRSGTGEGTTIFASFKRSHIDRKPLGDIGSTMLALICGHPQTRYILFYEKDGFRYGFDTDALTESLEGMPVNIPEVLMSIRNSINESVGGRDRSKPAAGVPDCANRQKEMKRNRRKSVE
ncbi:MAG: ATP-binding protein [Nitrospiraceae bacterium]|nr:ATP-binding protein [Nitrospiraceae bacterium]